MNRAAPQRTGLRPLPDGQGEQALLAQRAEALAQPLRADDADATGHQYLRVRVGAREQVGIPYPCLEEIGPANAITHVPCTPDFVAGVINRRGAILSVLRLDRFLGLESTTQAEVASVVVVSAARLTVGLLVDEVTGNEPYAPAGLGPPLPARGNRSVSWIRGIYGGCVVMLDPDALLENAAARLRGAIV